MNKKQRISQKGKKQAALGLAICFSAVIVITGAYTWNNYKDNISEELELAKEEQQAEAEKEIAEETNSGVEAEKKDVLEGVSTEGKNEQSADSTENSNSDGAAETTGSSTQIYFSDSDQLLWPVNGNVMMSYSMDKTVYF